LDFQEVKQNSNHSCKETKVTGEREAAKATMNQGGMVDQLRDSEGFGSETKICGRVPKKFRAKTSILVPDGRIISIIPIFFRVWLNRKSGRIPLENCTLFKTPDTVVDSLTDLATVLAVAVTFIERLLDKWAKSIFLRLSTTHNTTIRRGRSCPAPLPQARKLKTFKLVIQVVLGDSHIQLQAFGADIRANGFLCWLTGADMTDLQRGLGN